MGEGKGVNSLMRDQALRRSGAQGLGLWHLGIRCLGNKGGKEE